MNHLFDIKKNYFYYFLIIYFISGFFLSLNVGITHDEYHDFFVGEANKKKYLNIFFNQSYESNSLTGLNRYYSSGFHLLSAPIEYLLNFLLKLNYVSLETKPILIKHPSVFLFFTISSIFFRKIIYLTTNDKNYSSLSTILYLSYPYLIGHSFFNIKDIPFLSVWLICTYLIIYISNYYYKEKKIKFEYLLILSVLTSYLISIRISGILIFIEYAVFLLFTLNISKSNYVSFLKLFYKKILLFLSLTLILFYLLNPSYWNNPLDIIKGIKAMSFHIQTVCTITFGDCMKAQNLPSSYLPIWFFFKLPLLILFGLVYFIFKEKKFFSILNNKLIIAPILITTLIIIFLLILFNVNLYDELRQVMFIIPLIFIISLTALFQIPKKIRNIMLTFTIIFFVFQNIKIYPYNYIWLNNLTTITKINKNFELDYWGLSSKKIAVFLNTKNISSDTCVISNRNRGIKDFLLNKEICFLEFTDLHKKNKRPFYVALMERALDKGLPNNCKNIYNEKITMNFNREELVLAKVFKCD